MELYFYGENQGMRISKWSPVHSLSLATLLFNSNYSFEEVTDELAVVTLESPTPKWVTKQNLEVVDSNTVVDCFQNDLAGLERFPVGSEDLDLIPRTFGDFEEIEDFFSDEYIQERKISFREFLKFDKAYKTPEHPDLECGKEIFIYAIDYREYEVKLSLQLETAKSNEVIALNSKGELDRLNIANDEFVNCNLEYSPKENSEAIFEGGLGCSNCIEGYSDLLEEREVDEELFLSALSEIAISKDRFNLTELAELLLRIIEHNDLDISEFDSELEKIAEVSEEIRYLIEKIQE